jgi:hypothetical protein
MTIKTMRNTRKSMLRSHVRTFRHAAIILLFLLSTWSGAFAGSAMWNLNPDTGDWNTANNWTPATVPNGPIDIAAFGPAARVTRWWPIG